MTVFTAHEITHENHEEFDAISYSKFKYGLTTKGPIYAFELMEVFKKYNLNTGSNYIVYSSPYQHIPTATYCMAQSFFELLKTEMHGYGKEVLFRKLYRNPTYTVDYGTLTKDERLNLIGNDTFSFVTAPKKKHILIFLDDVKVTGSHEHVLKNSIAHFRVNNECILGYYAIVNQMLPAKHEHLINEAAISNIYDIIDLIKHKDFKFNTRVIKRILISTSADFHQLLDSIELRALSAIASLSKSNGYAEITEYSTNYNILLEHLNNFKD